jgi:hypothetical protein
MARWEPSDLERLEESRQLLVQAAGDLRFFESAVGSGSIPHTAQLRDSILAVKQEVAQATRLVDAGVAFYRGLQLRSGGAAPVYDSGGRIATESDEMEPELHA